MRVLVAGAGGQVGRALRATVPSGVELVAVDRSALDLTDRRAVASAVASVVPDVVVNAAAFTAVDAAETRRDEAAAVNRDGVEHLAHATGGTGGRMVQLSTDYVFDGAARRPYRPTDPTAPLSVYGRTKLEGEAVCRSILGDRALVLRTSRVYAAWGSNFVLRMLALFAGRERVRVVDDQVGSPTWAVPLAEAVWRAVEGGVSGVGHWCDGGACSWHELAAAVRDEAVSRDLVADPAPLDPVATGEVPAAASRPAYSVLDSRDFSRAIGVEPLPWRQALGRMLDAMATGARDA